MQTKNIFDNKIIKEEENVLVIKQITVNHFQLIHSLIAIKFF